MSESQTGAENESGNLGSSSTTLPGSITAALPVKSLIRERSARELDFQSLLAKFHNAVWEAAEKGTDFDLAGNDEAKALIAMFNGIPPLSDTDAIGIIITANIHSRETRIGGTTNWAGDIWRALKQGVLK